MTPRFTHNPRPMDGPNLPADWATTSKRGVIRLTLLSAGVMLGAAWAVFAMGVA